MSSTRACGQSPPKNTLELVHQSEPGGVSLASKGEPPLLSIVLTGRNDSYGGDFAARFFRTLQFNHEQLSARAITHEIVFVEWAPPPDGPLLFERLANELPSFD